MKTYIGAHQALSDEDFAELALGTPLALWLGDENETDEERAARLDAARDILNDDPELFDRVTRVAAQAIEQHAPELLNVIRLRAGDRRPRKAVAA